MIYIPHQPRRPVPAVPGFGYYLVQNLLPLLSKMYGQQQEIKGQEKLLGMKHKRAKDLLREEYRYKKELAGMKTPGEGTWSGFWVPRGDKAVRYAMHSKTGDVRALKLGDKEITKEITTPTAKANLAIRSLEAVTGKGFLLELDKSLQKKKSSLLAETFKYMKQGSSPTESALRAFTDAMKPKIEAAKTTKTKDALTRVQEAATGLMERLQNFAEGERETPPVEEKAPSAFEQLRDSTVNPSDIVAPLKRKAITYPQALQILLDGFENKGWTEEDIQTITGKSIHELRQALGWALKPDEVPEAFLGPTPY